MPVFRIPLKLYRDTPCDQAQCLKCMAQKIQDDVPFLGATHRTLGAIPARPNHRQEEPLPCRCISGTAVEFVTSLDVNLPRKLKKSTFFLQSFASWLLSPQKRMNPNYYSGPQEAYVPLVRECDNPEVNFERIRGAWTNKDAARQRLLRKVSERERAVKEAATLAEPPKPE